MNGLVQEDSYSRYPVLVIPGYGEPAFQCEMVGRQVRSSGLDTVTIRLPWMAMGDMTRSAGLVAEQAARVMETEGFNRVNLLGFSIGGLIARYFLQELDGYAALGRGAFVSSPNAGTYFGYLGFFSPAGRQVRPGSPFIQALNHSRGLEQISGRCLSIYVRWDGIILPHVSSYFPQGYNLLKRRPISHWRATTSGEIISYAAEFISGGLPEGAVPGHELGMLEAGEYFAVPLALPTRGRKRFWQVAWRPFRSLGARIASLFRRRHS